MQAGTALGHALADAACPLSGQQLVHEVVLHQERFLGDAECERSLVALGQPASKLFDFQLVVVSSGRQQVPLTPISAV